MSSAAQQLLCACITADMRSSNSCCAIGNQLVGDIFCNRYNLQRLSANFKNTLHPSPKWCKWLCISCFGRVKSALDPSPLFTHPSPQIFSLVVYRLRGDCKSPGFIGRTFFYSGLQIRWDAWRKTDAWRKKSSSLPLGVPADLQSAVKKCSTFSLRICNPQ